MGWVMCCDSNQQLLIQELCLKRRKQVKQKASMQSLPCGYIFATPVLLFYGILRERSVCPLRRGWENKDK